MNRIVSLYWNNIDPCVVATQRDVFSHFGLEIAQREQTGVNHGDFLDACMTEAGEDDIVLMVDIDCFPLNREIVDRAFQAASEGRIFGCAQTFGVDRDKIYVGPMFLAIARRTWDRLGRPSFTHDAHYDVAQRVNEAAMKADVPIELLYPWATIVPKWRLGDIALFGVGTFYKGGVFHLFESRRTRFRFILFDVAEAILNDRPVDYGALMRKAAALRGDSRWAQRFARWKGKIWRLLGRES